MLSERVRAAASALFAAFAADVSAEDVQELGPRQREALPLNFSLIALNGIFLPVAGRILSAGLLLTWFVSGLTQSAFWVGLIVPVQKGLALLAQPLVAAWLTGKPRLHLYYTAEALLRAVLWGALGLAAWLLGPDYSRPLLAGFFIVLAIDAAAGGVGNIAFNDTIARTIPRRLRGRARGSRGAVGGAMTAAIGLLLAANVSERSGLGVFALLFAGSGLAYALGGLLIGLARVPARDSEHFSSPGASEVLHTLRSMLQRGAFRLFVGVQALLVPLVYGLPFFTLFARRSFGLELKSVGLLLVVDALTPVVANAVWGRLSDARGNRWVLGGSGLVGLLAPLCAAALLAGPLGSWAVLPLFAAIVFALSAALAGFQLASKNYVLDLAPGAEQRPLYIGMNDTLVALPTLLLAGGGIMIDLLGYAPLFALLGAASAGAFLLSLRLPSHGGAGS